MILQALTAYYEQLLRQGKIAAPGWDGRFKVSYELRLNDAGQLVDVVDLRVSETKGKKTVIVPRELRVPAHVKRTVASAWVTPPSSAGPRVRSLRIRMRSACSCLVQRKLPALRKRMCRRR